MTATSSRNLLSASRAISWLASVVVFTAAAALQIATFGIVVPQRLLANVASPIAIGIAVAWLVLPPLVATVLAVRRFRLLGHDRAQRSTPGLLAILVLPLLSVYLGVAVSFNVWGGK
jgi:hypothetical protein